MSKRPRISPATLFFALLSVVLGFALYLKTRPSPEPAVPQPVLPVSPPSPLPVRPPRASALPRRSSEPARGRAPEARVAIVIDDLGNDPSAVERISRWREPISVAVLPALSGSAWAAQQLESSGKEVLLHLPMEPKGFPAVRPGPGVLLREQSDEEIGRMLEADLLSVPGAVGVNNHMGSAATADQRVMRAVMRVLARRGLFFVDSRTTDATVAESEARAAGVPVVSRRVFLDAIPLENAVERCVEELAARGRLEGAAVGIGHPHSATLGVLEREMPRLRSQGVRLVKVGELVK